MSTLNWHYKYIYTAPFDKLQYILYYFLFSPSPPFLLLGAKFMTIASAKSFPKKSAAVGKKIRITAHGLSVPLEETVTDKKEDSAKEHLFHVCIGGHKTPELTGNRLTGQWILFPDTPCQVEIID